MSGDPGLQQLSDSMGDDSCLPASGSGKDQQWPFDVQNRFALGGRQSIEQVIQEEILGRANVVAVQLSRHSGNCRLIAGGVVGSSNSGRGCLSHFLPAEIRLQHTAPTNSIRIPATHARVRTQKPMTFGR